jgi:hypothetical protein
MVVPGRFGRVGEFNEILNQSARGKLYIHLCNYTNDVYNDGKIIPIIKDIYIFNSLKTGKL